ncbi:CPBP family intramembrane glutamic endopeptidase [Pseudothermotoga sp. U03pept]|uniref:CPBP family intramembrane glutamic endopeptidase n=1 Tax=Pseudothermotoga sp. U03pept TaxID=3447012 RepID=UPI003F0F1348
MNKSILRFLIFITMLWIGTLLAYYFSSMWFVATWYASLFALSLYFTLKTGESFATLFRFNRRWILKSILCLPLVYLLVAVVSFLFPTVQQTTQLTKIDTATAIVVAFLGPISEEMAFRGYAQGIVRRKLSVNSTIMISALFFSLFHSFEVFPQIFVMSLVLSAVREVSGSIVPSMIIHCLNNTIALLVNFFV